MWSQLSHLCSWHSRTPLWQRARVPGLIVSLWDNLNLRWVYLRQQPYFATGMRRTSLIMCLNAIVQTLLYIDEPIPDEMIMQLLQDFIVLCLSCDHHRLQCHDPLFASPGDLVPWRHTCQGIQWLQVAVPWWPLLPSHPRGLPGGCWDLPRGGCELCWRGIHCMFPQCGP